eukprot:TRINITY_DN65512_c0_g1_i1.p2 TRINITY_DN65512_c0_g1~~TRINITY_DN65512_c0_g1_i1.p2  ORF type:complete len:111 (-),score=18.36 TRINITY_DN65512_c0_g1_i1:115-447(-)
MAYIPLDVKDQSQLDKEINSGKLVVVDFFATWCGPCKRIAPALAELSESESDVVFLKVDVDVCEDIAGKYEVESMPTFLFFKSGELKLKVIGANIAKIKEGVTKFKQIQF